MVFQVMRSRDKEVRGEDLGDHGPRDWQRWNACARPSARVLQPVERRLASPQSAPFSSGDWSEETRQVSVEIPIEIPGSNPAVNRVSADPELASERTLAPALGEVVPQLHPRLPSDHGVSTLVKTHGEMNHRPGARLSSGSQTVPTVRFWPATSVEFTAAVNNRATRVRRLFARWAPASRCHHVATLWAHSRGSERNAEEIVRRVTR